VLMPTYRVVCTGQITEIYLVDAANEDEALKNWHEGEMLNSESWDVSPDYAKLDDE